MELRRPIHMLTQAKPGAPQWTVSIKCRHEQAEIYADLSDRIVATNLHGTLRYQRLDLRSGGADLDELVQQIRDEIKNQWAVRYIEVDTKSIALEAALASTPDASQVTRFTAGIDGVSTAALDIPRLSLPSGEQTHPFGLSDVDWQRLPEMQQAARDNSRIADAKVISVVAVKPKREFGDNEIEWRIEVEAADARPFASPNSPPTPRATGIFDAKGKFVRMKYPRGEGPQVDLLDPPALAKALAIVGTRLGPTSRLARC
jgi:hypothetical protein